MGENTKIAFNAAQYVLGLHSAPAAAWRMKIFFFF